MYENCLRFGSYNLYAPFNSSYSSGSNPVICIIRPSSSSLTSLLMLELLFFSSFGSSFFSSFCSSFLFSLFRVLDNSFSESGFFSISDFICSLLSVLELISFFIIGVFSNLIIGFILTIGSFLPVLVVF